MFIANEWFAICFDKTAPQIPELYMLIQYIHTYEWESQPRLNTHHSPAQELSAISIRHSQVKVLLWCPTTEMFTKLCFPHPTESVRVDIRTNVNISRVRPDINTKFQNNLTNDQYRHYWQFLSASHIVLKHRIKLKLLRYNGQINAI